MSIVINRPKEEIFTYLANLENDAKWRREWVAAKHTSEVPVGMGATFLLVGELLDRRMETVYETTEYVPNRTSPWKVVSGSLPLTYRRTIERVEGGTHDTIRYEMEMCGFIKLGKPLFINLGKRQLEGDFTKLKGLMETRAM